MSDAPHIRDLILAFAHEHGTVTREDAYDLEGRHDRVGHAAAGRALRDLVRTGLLTGPDDDGNWTLTERGAAHVDDGRSAAPTTGAASPLNAAVPVSDTADDDPVNGGGRFGRHRPRPTPSAAADERVRRILEQADALEAAGAMDDQTRELVRQARAAHADHWRLRVPAMFPGMVKSDFAPHQEELWDWVWSVNEPGTLAQPDPFVALWPRGHAKCRWVEDEVLYADGSRRRLGDVRVGDRVAAYDERTGRMTAATVAAYTDSGTKPCLRLRTRTGKEATVTADHRMLTYRGWVTAGDIVTGDRIASPRRTVTEGEAPRPDWEVALAAYVLAEGGTTGRSVIVTNTDDVLRDDITACACAGGFTPVAADATSFRINGAAAWVRRNPELKGRATQKRVPAWVYRLPFAARCRFLAVMFDTDGFVSRRAGQFAITLANRPLIEDIVHLAASVGIVGGVIERPNDHAGAWQFTVDQECLQHAATVLPLRLKGGRLRDLLERRRYSLADVYPASVMRDLPAGVNRLLRRHGVRVGGTGAVTRAKVRAALAVHPLERWDALERSDVFWDEVVVVEDAGELPTADLTVPGPENFVCGMLVTHNSSTAEMAAVMLGHRRRRRYCLYVSGTQAKADDHVQAIAELLESPQVAQIDPELCERRVGMYGQSKGWRHNRLTTQAGFTVDAVGLDVDVRGARIDDARPDVIIFDDVDSVTDTPPIIERKLLRITRDLIPAGSQDLVILFAQNVIHNMSIAARLGGVDGAPDPGFLYTRIVSGPIPAIEGFEFAERYDPDLDRNRVFVTGGEPTWSGYDLDACQVMIDREGIVSFLAECQHKQGTLKGGMFDHIDFSVRRGSLAELPALRPVDAPDGYNHPTWPGPCTVWCDPAVTSTDKSDSCAVTVGAIAPDRKLWCLYAWEQVASPETAMRVAIEAGMRWGAQVCGFETDQGGDTWEVVYRKVVADLLADPDSFVAVRHSHGVPVPRYDFAKAGGAEGNLSKRQRIAQLVVRYDLDEFRHLDSAALALEAGLSRFPKYKPFDVADSWWHNWRWLSRQRGGESGGRGYKGRNPARRQGPLPDVTPS